MKKQKKGLSAIVEASLTIEAAMGLIVFIFTVICLIMPMKMLNTQRRVQMTLEAASRELSQYAYIRYRMSEGETGIDEKQAENSTELSSLFTGAAASVYLTAKIEAAAGKGRVEKMNFSKTKLSENGEEIDLRVEYRLKLPFSFFALDSVPASSRSMRRGWIGSAGGRAELGSDRETDGKDVMVYVGNSMGRYHRSKSCHYISNDITGVAYGDIENQRSKSGKKYRPCSVCGKNAGEGKTVYILPDGEYYHSRKECSSLAYYVREVPLREVEYLGECSYCGKKEKN